MKFGNPLILSALLGAFGAPSALQAEVLIEVFTAENCEFCRVAEKSIATLADEDEDLIAIAYHLDYWDYLGEPDRFANPLFAARQVGYNDADALKELFTPQIIIQGQPVEENKLSEENLARIESAKSEDALRAHIEDDDQNYSIEFEKSEAFLGDDLRVVLAVIYSDEEIESILQSDENAKSDKDTDETQELVRLESLDIVKSLERIEEWNDDDPLKISFSLEEKQSAIVFLQENEFGKIVYAQKFSADDGANP